VAKVMDVLDKSQYPSKKFDIAIDKGTYDAIALCPDNSKAKRLQYKEFLCNILKPNGLFIITSCNWTSAELIEFFTKENGNFLNRLYSSEIVNLYFSYLRI